MQSEDLTCTSTLRRSGSDAQNLRTDTPEKREMQTNVKADTEKLLTKQPRTQASCLQALDQKRRMSIGAIAVVLSILILAASSFKLFVGSELPKYVCRSVAQNAAASS